MPPPLRMPSVPVCTSSSPLEGRTSKVKLVPLIAATFFMVSGGPYGIEDILGGAGYLRALVILLLLPFLWSLPTALMIGELASAIPAEGGFYVWVRRALGPFWGFAEAWLSLAASIFDMAIYPTLAVLYLGRLAPGLTAGHRALLWSLVVIVLAAGLNLRGASAVGKSSVVLSLLLLLPFAVLTAAGLWAALHAHLSFAQFTHAPTPDLSTAILVAMWNYMGWDNASTVAGEVDQPRRNYPRAMLGTLAVVAVSYIVPLAAVALAGIPPASFSTGSWVDAGRALAGPALGLAIVAGGVINGFGMFNALMLSYTRLPVVLAEDGLLPAWLAARNRWGVPWAAILLCACGWALALGFTFERLISIDLTLYGGSLVLEFIALVVLRVREPALARPFRVPGGLAVAALLGVVPTSLIVYALAISHTERMAGIPTLLFGALIAAAGAIVYAAMRLATRRSVLTTPTLK